MAYGPNGLERSSAVFNGPEKIGTWTTGSKSFLCPPFFHIAAFTPPAAERFSPGGATARRAAFWTIPTSSPEPIADVAQVVTFTSASGADRFIDFAGAIARKLLDLLSVPLSKLALGRAPLSEYDFSIYRVDAIIPCAPWHLLPAVRTTLLPNGRSCEQSFAAFHRVP
jgi:hypothetical protein